MTNQVYQRIDLAKEQLEIAIELFLEKRSFVSALTLAGAAEEIFGKALSHQGKINILEHEYGVIKPLEDALSKAFRRAPFDRKSYYKRKNHSKNAAKHMDSASNLTLEVNIEDEALDMIVRAYGNYSRLKYELTNIMRAFNNWFNENIAGW